MFPSTGMPGRPQTTAVPPATVLVVEDNLDQWCFIQLAFKQHADVLVPTLARTEWQALNFLQQCAYTNSAYPRLVLLDLYLPTRENGLQFLQLLRSKPAPVGTLPVVMLTHSDKPDDITVSFQNGIDGYIIKPTIFSDWPDYIEDLRKNWLSTDGC